MSFCPIRAGGCLFPHPLRLLDVPRYTLPEIINLYNATLACYDEECFGNNTEWDMRETLNKLPYVLRNPGRFWQRRDLREWSGYNRRPQGEGEDKVESLSEGDEGVGEDVEGLSDGERAEHRQERVVVEIEVEEIIEGDENGRSEQQSSNRSERWRGRDSRSRGGHSGGYRYSEGWSSRW
ncbi:hypothetical protein K458DRAFT_388208 [Lentithecium fluviatile CBS 122367]|uniref:Uncharacterized protein n=1 Tax=Lentithecium fluviatile CBS 122367 TaxID=1168545 RepID=A0A6G1J543_9PLEO|nr:hypothetical protein K458DRAFT_388208 [Lentithecium fluviatile CBS 122367]